MTKQTFTHKPVLSSELSEEPSVSILKFGDGYESRIPNGLNNQLLKWSLTFETPMTEQKQILQFLRNHGGVKSFLWVAPDGVKNTYVCRSWKSRQREFGVYEVNCTFEQVIDL